MKVGLYTIRDMKAEFCHQPFTTRTDAEAIRMFGDMAEKSDNMIGQHPEDFQLLKVAYFDLELGIITPVDHVALATASDFGKKVSNEN